MEGRKHSTLGWCTWLAILVLFPTLYVLSVGPAVYLNRRGLIPDQAGVVYIPLAFVCDYCPPLSQLVDWYATRFETL